MLHRRLTAVLCALLAFVSAIALVPSARGDEPRRPSRGRHDGEHVLVGFRRGTPSTARAGAHAERQSRVENRFDHIDVDVVEVPDGADPVEVAARYERNPTVEFAHPNWEVGISSEPNDTLFGEQWGLHNTGQTVTGNEADLIVVDPVAGIDVDGPEGWDAAFGPGQLAATGGRRVAVIDTGIDRGHVDLLDKTKACASALAAIGIVTSGTCDDDGLHGTHVAGTVAALTGNGVGVAGVAPNAELAIFKALNGAGVGFVSDIIAGIRWAYTEGGARIISMSLGSAEESEAEERAVKEAAGAGVLVIAAAGNDDQETTKNYPAAYADVMSVSSVSQDGRLSAFSTCNGDVEIGAPGEDVWSTLPGNSYGVFSGTSMATPHVSGIAAMVWWQNPSLSADQVRSTLRATTEGSAGCAGAGVVNLARALGASSEPAPPPPGPGTISGSVTNQKTRAAIANAIVDCGPGGSATTASNGTYTITDAPSGQHSCTASASGYRAKTQAVTVSTGQDTTANFALRQRR